MPTHAERAPTYHTLFDADVKPDRQAEAAAVAKQIFANKGVYEAITRKTGVPYWWQGPTHYREASLNFNKHLHEGSPLTDRTKNIPKGRPATGSPPFTFEESAIDALKMPPHSLHQVPRWSPERGCYEWERYNGWGYLRRGGISAYVFSGTFAYKSGKFVADGKYDPNVVDKQLGTVVILKELAKLDPDVAKALRDREPSPPKDVLDQATKGARNGRTLGGGVAGGGVAGEATRQGTQQPDQPSVLSPALTMTAIAAGIVIMIVATILISRKLALMHSKWGA